MKYMHKKSTKNMSMFMDRSKTLGKTNLKIDDIHDCYINNPTKKLSILGVIKAKKAE